MNTIKVKDEYGRHVKGWTFRHVRAVTQIGVYKNGVQQSPRLITGWELIAPGEKPRFCEGNWQQFVPFARLIIENHGYTTNLS